jgi:hypothetical protein
MTAFARPCQRGICAPTVLRGSKRKLPHTLLVSGSDPELPFPDRQGNSLDRFAVGRHLIIDVVRPLLQGRLLALNIDI